MANSYFNENTLEELIEEIKYVYKSDDRPWVIGYSGGKDSTTVVELVYKMLLGLDPDDRHKNVYIVSSDTLIENPLIKIYLSKMNDLLGQAADRDGLPIKSAMVTPPPNNSFWANVIGRGFPTPRMNGTFRWCTDRLKINPSGEYIQRVIDEEGKEVVVLLGVRKAESIARKRRIEGRELANRLLNRHETIQDAYVYNPIVELTTDDVWDVLLRCDGGRTPWGSDNSELVSLYADADSGECPFAGIHAGGQTQSCGNSRFNKSALLDSIRLMAEMGLLLKNIKIKKITEEQMYLVAAYNAILRGENAEIFALKKNFSESEIDNAVKIALVAKDKRRGKEVKAIESVDCNTVVIHGIHQFRATKLEGDSETDGVIDLLKKLKKQISKLNNGKIEYNEQLAKLSYFNVELDEIDELIEALEALNTITKIFYEDFENENNNFKHFYEKLKDFVETQILPTADAETEFQDILLRLLARLEEVEKIESTSTFDCLKDTMAYYLKQESQNHL